MTKTYILTETLSVIEEEQEEAKEYDTTSIVEKGPEIHTIYYRDLTLNYKTVKHAERIALEKGKPLYTTWYKGSMTGNVFVGEYTINPENPKNTRYPKYLINILDSGFYNNFIKKIYKINEDFIIVTCYAVFIVSSKIRKRKLLRN
jgi:hypothetical protein